MSLREAIIHAETRRIGKEEGMGSESAKGEDALSRLQRAVEDHPEEAAPPLFGARAIKSAISPGKKAPPSVRPRIEGGATGRPM